MHLDPVSLRLFLYVVEAGSIAGAATRGNISASAVSKRMSDLEDILKTKLLARTNKGVVTTSAGEALTQLARSILYEMDDICIQMRHYALGTCGRVRVAANLSAITQFLPATVKQFLGEYPLVQILLQENTSAEVIKNVTDNAADIGIFTSAPCEHNLRVLPYHSDELALIVPGDHGLTSQDTVAFKDTLEFDYVGLRSCSAINLQLTRIASKLGMTIKMAIQVTSFDAVCKMVGAGLGIAILPRTAATPYLQTHGIRVLSLIDDWAVRELKICVRSVESLPAVAQLLLKYLQDKQEAHL